MAEISSNRLDSFIGSSRVIQIFDNPDLSQSTNGTSGRRLEMRDGGGDELSGEFNPVDAWLAITGSRNGSTLTAAFHLLCSGIGVQVLPLPIALVSLGWFWGILCLSIAFSWQLYTIWLLVNLHEPSPVTRIRYSRFIDLSILAFGEKLGKLLAIFPTVYLSGGTCVLYIITGGAVMKIFFNSMCGGDLDAVTGAEFFFAFVCMAILVAQFFPTSTRYPPLRLLVPSLHLLTVAFCGCSPCQKE